MLQLLNPWALLAATTLAVPVIIHLWRVRTGKTLKIGSIALLRECARPSARSLRLRDRWLLLVRCLLLAVLVLWLAEPVWRVPADTASPGWVLADPAVLRETYQHFARDIDSLLQAGYVLHAFSPGFPPMTLADTAADATPQPSKLSYWSLLRGLSQHLPADAAVYVFTPNRLSGLRGSKPALPFRLLRWAAYTPTDTTSYRLLQAYQTSRDSLRLVTLQSNRQHNQVRILDKSVGAEDTSYTLTIAEGQPMVRWGKDTATILPLDTGTWKVTLYADSHQTDALYIRAALEAIQSLTKRPLRIQQVTSPEALPAEQNVLLWLSERPLPNSIRQRLQEKGLVLRYASGRPQKSMTQLYQHPEAGTHQKKISLYRRIMPDTLAGISVWQDSQGVPALVELSGTTYRHYVFYSRFDPTWTDLVWHPQFAAWLWPLLLPSPADQSPIEDQRTVADQQLMPAQPTSALTVQLPDAYADHHLGTLCWWIAAMLLVTERLLSHRKKPTTP